MTVTVTPVDEAPVIRRSQRESGDYSIVENSLTTRVVGSYMATDPEGAGVTWSDLSGNDAADFDLSNNGVLTFKVSPDYEMKHEYEVTLNAFDGRFTGSLDVTVTIADENEQPMVTRSSGTGAFSIAENSGTTVGDFDATDPENDDVTWSLASGGDSRFFEIDAANGALSFKESEFNENEIPDYESTGLGSDKAYNVTVRATEADDGDTQTREPWGSLAVTVAVTDVNEPPTITENATPSVPENTTAVATYRATDPDERATITWSVEDPGAGDFTITNAGGALSFASAPNYEVKSSYTVTVRASDGTNTDDHVVTVAVTDVNEPEVLVLSHRTPLIGEEFTAAFEGTGDNVTSLTWQWRRSTNRSSAGTVIVGATAETYRPVGDDRDYYLRVTASYNDGHGQARKTLQATSEFATLPDSTTNTAPTFPSTLFTGGQTGLSVRENAVVRTVVGVAPQATDTDPGSRSLSYSLAVDGFPIDPPFTDPPFTDPPFEINATSRQIRVASGAVLDHEDQDTYSVTVTVVDEFNATDTATFDITIDGRQRTARGGRRPIGDDRGGYARYLRRPRERHRPRRGRHPDRDDHHDAAEARARGGGPRHADADLHAGQGRPRHVHVHVHGQGRRPGQEAHQPPRPGHGHHQRGQRRAGVRDRNDHAHRFRERPGRATTVGTKVEATDVDDITLTYSLSGASEFVIDDTGQISVAPGVTLDRELISSYEATVTATDRLNESDSITVTINVSDVPEPPTAVNDTATTDEDQSGQNRRARQRHGSRYGASQPEGLGADAAAQRTRTRRERPDHHLHAERELRRREQLHLPAVRRLSPRRRLGHGHRRSGERRPDIPLDAGRALRPRKREGWRQRRRRP